MNKSRLLSWVCCLTLSLGGFAEGAEMKLRPISADGSHSVVGNEIILDGGGQRVFLELRLSGWAPDSLSSYQGVIDSSGYSSGTFGVLTAAVAPCTQNSDCEAVFGTGANCTFDGKCPGGFINGGRADYVFAGGTSLPAVDTSLPDYRYSSLILFTTQADPGGERYGGTLVLDVPVGAHGTFTIPLIPGVSSMTNQDNLPVSPLTLTSAVITVLCTSNADCFDGNACTDDQCNFMTGICSNPNNYNEADDCCNPLNGVTTAIDDNNECTEDLCDTNTGQVTHDPFPNGTSCGDSTNTECDNPDTCDGLGNCQANLEPNGFSCGDSSDTECTNPDTCDGAGACQDNHEVAGTSCGNASDTDCDKPDTCDGSGACQNNWEPNGTVCDDLLFCNVNESCTDGSCGGGTAQTCDDGIPCTTDSCDEDADTCVNDLNAGFCLITGFCRSEGEINTLNDCEECNTAVSTADWTPRPSGASCGDGSDTDCTNPDTCDGAGSCQDNHESPGTFCGDPTDDDCTNPDTCNANGVCLDNHETNGTACTDDGNECTFDECDNGICDHPNRPGGTPCGDPSNTDCDNPDTCNVVGVCQDNHEPDNSGCTDDTNDCTNDVCSSGLCTHPNKSLGAACGDQTDTDCDNPDTCDGAGTCEDNLEPGGFACTDDGNDCTSDVCDGAGTCDHPNLGIGVACGDTSDTDCTNPDTCDGAGACQDNHETAGTACGDVADTVCTNPDTCDGDGSCLDNHEPDGTNCDDTLFCNGEDLCDTGVCEHAGSPCGGPCSEDEDRCLCEAPIVTQAGNRYLKILPQPPDSGPQAILITPDCPGAAARYVNGPSLLFDPDQLRAIDMDRDGLVDEMTAGTDGAGAVLDNFHTPAQWGELYAYGLTITPGQTYIVQGDCGSPGSPGLSEAASVTTCIFGDTVGEFDQQTQKWTPCNGFPVDILDLVAVVERFMNLSRAAPVDWTDIVGTGGEPIECIPDQDVGIIPDAVIVVKAFQGFSYKNATITQTRPGGCQLPCP